MSEIDQFKLELRRTDYVALETTTNARYFHGQVVGLVARVVVVNPYQFEVIRRSVKRTDERDALVLAQFVR